MLNHAMKIVAGVSCAISLSACGGEAVVMQPIEAVAPVRFEYHASTEVDQALADRLPGCAQSVGFTHIHASWRDFTAYRFKPEGAELWALTFPEVPIGNHKIRVSDANACDTHPTGAVTDLAVYANGVLLTQQVDTPGDGIEPGFRFIITEDERVEP